VATLNFDHLPAGKVHVVVNAFDANHNLISYGGADAQIVAGQVATVAVNCSAADGKLVVTFNCPLLCGPSTAPSATPTPTPTATATPTPHPPANPTAAGLTNFVTGMVIDDKNNIHLIAYDPDATPYANKPNHNRIIRVPADLSNNGTVYADDLAMWSFDGIFRGGRIVAGNLDSAQIPEYDATTGARLALDSQVVQFPNSNVGMQPNCYTLDSTGQVVTSYQYNAAHLFAIEQLLAPKTLYVWHLSDHFLSFAGHSIVMDENDIPIFPADRQIATGLGTPTAPMEPAILETMPATLPTSTFFGIAKTDVASKFLLSVTGSTSIYVWDRNDPAGPVNDFTQNVAVTMPGGEFPHQIKRAPNGQYYVLCSKGDINANAIDLYRVYRFDLVNGHLTNATLMVSDY
jgi:hypothetical protein